eukprot:gene1151-3715_t
MDFDAAIKACPFLRNVSLRQGDEYARSIAINPMVPAPMAKRPLLEETDDFANTFRLFHGPQSPVPLNREVSVTPARHADTAPEIKFLSTSDASPGVSTGAASNSRKRSPLADAPFASLSLGFGGMPDFGGLFRKFQQHQEDIKLNNSRVNKRVGPEPKADVARAPHSSLPQHGAPAAAGSCPIRKMLGPHAGLVFNSAGKIHCPEIIVTARAALAATDTVKVLRPQSLATRFAAVALAASALNVPAGMWREHTKKFSLEWVLAVHATIPFVAMFRKALLMPKIAILFTIMSAVAGQAIGARLERERLLRLQTSRELAAMKLELELAASKPPVKRASKIRTLFSRKTRVQARRNAASMSAVARAVRTLSSTAMRRNTSSSNSINNSLDSHRNSNLSTSSTPGNPPSGPPPMQQQFPPQMAQPHRHAGMPPQHPSQQQQQQQQHQQTYPPPGQRQHPSQQQRPPQQAGQQQQQYQQAGQQPQRPPQQAGQQQQQYQQVQQQHQNSGSNIPDMARYGRRASPVTGGEAGYPMSGALSTPPESASRIQSLQKLRSSSAQRQDRTGSPSTGDPPMGSSQQRTPQQQGGLPSRPPLQAGNRAASPGGQYPPGTLLQNGTQRSASPSSGFRAPPVTQRAPSLASAGAPRSVPLQRAASTVLRQLPPGSTAPPTAAAPVPTNSRAAALAALAARKRESQAAAAAAAAQQREQREQAHAAPPPQRVAPRAAPPPQRAPPPPKQQEYSQDFDEEVPPSMGYAIPPGAEDPGPTGPMGYAIPPGAEDPGPTGPMSQCQSCGRKFNQLAYSKHSKICQKVFVQKRKVYNVAAARVEGSEAAKFFDAKKGKPNTKFFDTKKGKPKSELQQAGQ